jgi:biopolymer transport protein ExbB
MNPETLTQTTLSSPATLGVGHFLSHADTLGSTLLVVLLLMSVLSWTLIVLRVVDRWLTKKRGAAFLLRFWNAPSIDDVAAELKAASHRDPFSLLTQEALQAQAHHAKHGVSRLAEAGSASDFVIRTIKKTLDGIGLSMETGLTVLATVGATAPFVGLFGTVWGVYQALVNIGLSGAGTLDKVAGPVGEALIMTGLGLAVAIPAVMAYNVFTRSNRVLAAQLDAFAYELHTLVAMGHALGGGAAMGRSLATDASGSTSPANVQRLSPRAAQV